LNGLLAVVARATGTTPDPIHEPSRAGDIRRSQADITAARKLLGYEPAVDIDEGIRRTVEWFSDPRRREMT
jgi:nucleoside-diphosphate-sugar epimerase